jgi:HAE1 family hydrophobic/amphiphilic exporter-1
VNHFHIFFYLKPNEDRTVTQETVMTRVRQVLAKHPGLAPAISPKNPLGGGNGNFAIQATLQGPDMGKLYDYSQQLLLNAQKLPSLVDAKSNFSNASPEVHVSVDRGRAADLGVRISDIGSALRLMVAGDDEISSFRDGAEQYPVKIRVLEHQRGDVAAISKLTVPSSTSGQVRIDNIAQMVRGFGPTQLRRLNRQFAIEVQADLAPGHALDEGSADMRRLMTELNMAPGYSFSMRGQTQYLDETTTNLLLAIGLASIFVYIVLAAQFESFIQPIIIMLALPVSVPFALFTIWITGRTLNLWSALGILLLFGIVKKNSILQVDYTNVLRRRGVPMHEAIVEACRTRLRPILMTTSAIVAGLLPTALGLGIGGQQRSAIAMTIIGGQGLCLFLTLLLVPVAYVQFDTLEQAVISGKARAWLARVSPLRRTPPEPHAP